MGSIAFVLLLQTYGKAEIGVINYEAEHTVTGTEMSNASVNTISCMNLCNRSIINVASMSSRQQVHLIQMVKFVHDVM